MINQPIDSLLSFDETRARLGNPGRASIYRWIQSEPNFPKPLKIGRLTRFRESEVQAYIASLADSANTAA